MRVHMRGCPFVFMCSFAACYLHHTILGDHHCCGPGQRQQEHGASNQRRRRDPEHFGAVAASHAAHDEGAGALQNLQEGEAREPGQTGGCIQHILSASTSVRAGIPFTVPRMRSASTSSRRRRHCPLSSTWCIDLSTQWCMDTASSLVARLRKARWWKILRLCFFPARRTYLSTLSTILSSGAGLSRYSTSQHLVLLKLLKFIKSTEATDR